MLTAVQRQAAPWYHPVHFLAYGFGSGLVPKAPGTFGSLAAFVLIWPLATLGLHWYLLATVLACVVGISICRYTAEKLGVHDHGAIVWDEVAGMLIAFIAIPLSWDTLLLGFVLFRILDISKPSLIGVVDKRFYGGLGIMLDDLLAGAVTLGCLHVYVYAFG